MVMIKSWDDEIIHHLSKLSHSNGLALTGLNPLKVQILGPATQILLPLFRNILIDNLFELRAINVLGSWLI